MAGIKCYILGIESVDFEADDRNPNGKTLIKVDLYDPTAERQKYQTIWMSPDDLEKAGFKAAHIVDWDEVNAVSMELGASRLGRKARPVRISAA